MNDWMNAETHAERAHRFYEAGQWDKALRELERALAVNPHQSEWHFGMGLTLEAMGRHREAAEAFQRVLDLRGDNDLESMLNLAANLTRCDQAERAIQILEDVNAIDPQCEPGFCLRIEAYARLGDHDNAELMFYLARQLVDECPACYDALAHSLAQRGEMDRAIWCWHQTARLDPKFPGLFTSLARVHWHRGNHLRAHRLYLRQLRQDPADTQAMVELGELLIEMGRDAEAADRFRQVLATNSRCAEAHLHLGVIALRSGDFAAAQQDLEIARRSDPHLPGVSLGLAQIAYQRRQLDLALSLLREETRRKGHQSAQTLEMARLLIDMQQPRLAIRLLTAMIERQIASPRHYPNLPVALLYRGVARSLGGDLAGSIKDYRKALHLDPTQVAAMQNLATAYLDARNIRRATYWLRRARQARPHDPQVRQIHLRLTMTQMMELAHRVVKPLRRLGGKSS